MYQKSNTHIKIPQIYPYLKTIKYELIKDYDKFIVKIIQIYYNDNYKKYEPIKEENITNKVCI